MLIRSFNEQRSCSPRNWFLSTTVHIAIIWLKAVTEHWYFRRGISSRFFIRFSFTSIIFIPLIECTAQFIYPSMLANRFPFISHRFSYVSTAQVSTWIRVAHSTKIYDNGTKELLLFLLPPLLCNCGLTHGTGLPPARQLPGHRVWCSQPLWFFHLAYIL